MTTDQLWRWVDDRTIEVVTQKAKGKVTGTVSWPTAELAQANYQAALRRYAEKDIDALVRMDGQGQKTTRHGHWFFTVLWGPPTWWWPQVHLSIKNRKVMVGWLRRGYVLAWLR